MSIFKKHVFVCTSGKTCPTQGGEEICFEMKNIISDLGLKKEIRINKAGCMGQCGKGPIVVVYPEAVWYAPVKMEDVKEIIEKHLLNDQVVERLLYENSSQK